MDYKEYLVECGKKMLHSGLTVETWGQYQREKSGERIILFDPIGHAL